MSEKPLTDQQIEDALARAEGDMDGPVKSRQERIDLATDLLAAREALRETWYRIAHSDDCVSQSSDCICGADAALRNAHAIVEGGE